MGTVRNFKIWNMGKKRDSKKNGRLLLTIFTGIIIVLLGIDFISSIKKIMSQPGQVSDNFLVKSEDYFFKTKTLYYFKGELGENKYGSIVRLLKVLKNNKTEVNEAISSLNLAEANTENSQQNLFYLNDNKTCYMFVVNPGKKTTEKSLLTTIEISISWGKNLSKTLGVFHLNQNRDATEGLTYDLSYNSGRFNKANGKPLSFGYLNIEKPGKDLGEVLNTLVDGIKSAIDLNPIETSNNGNRINFKFKLIKVNKSEKQPISEDFLLFSRKISIPHKGGESSEINGFQVTDDGKSPVYKLLLKNTEELFENSKNNYVEQKGLKFYKDTELIAENNLDIIGENLNAIISKNDCRNFEEWNKSITSAQTSIHLENFIGYIEIQLKNIVQSHENQLIMQILTSKKRQAILSGLLILLVLTIYLILQYLWFGDIKEKNNDSSRGLPTIDGEIAIKLSVLEIQLTAIILTLDQIKTEIKANHKPDDVDKKEDKLKLNQVIAEINQNVLELKIKLDNINSFKEKFDCLSARAKKYEDLGHAIFEPLFSSSSYNCDNQSDYETFITNTIRANIEGQKNIVEKIGKFEEKIDKINTELKNADNVFQSLALINKQSGFEVEVNRSNIDIIFKKVNGEISLSKKYRRFAIDLYDELSDLKFNYQKYWFWDLIELNFLAKLRSMMPLFKISIDGKSIYDHYLKDDVPLRLIDKKHIKRVVENYHWIQIWDGVIRMNDFFNAYFDDDKADIKSILIYFSQKIKVFLNDQGYSIEEIKPFSVISDELIKNKKIGQKDKSDFVETTLKNLIETQNIRFKKVVETMNNDCERIFYVEQLKLTDILTNPQIEIGNNFIISYKKGTLKTHLDSFERILRKGENNLK